jgi:putative glutamine amidotransferase
MKPVVAVSATTRVTDGVERVRLNASYLHALEAAGLVPLVVPPLDGSSDVESILRAVHGLVLTGGEDIDPSRYGAEPRPPTHAAHARRDACEIALTLAARHLALPTLAICRGVQLANVALGGTLVQDIPSERTDALVHDGGSARNARVHEVRIEPGSRLASAIGTSSLTVNSSHHQAVDCVAPRLRVNAAAPDGVSEGLEWAASDWWMVGVQWHPEELVDDKEAWDRSLFAAFAAECSRRAADQR